MTSPISILIIFSLLLLYLMIRSKSKDPFEIKKRAFALIFLGGLNFLTVHFFHFTFFSKTESVQVSTPR